jgi:type IV secretory pathway protease TraF
MVDVTREGVLVNGQILTNSRPMDKKARGHQQTQLLVGSRVQLGTVWWVSSYHSWSFNSQYFGPISNNLLGGIAKFVWSCGFKLDYLSSG